MQLIGVPCHLISSNEFYDQKRASLSVKGTLEEFLANPKEYLPDYNDKLKLRREWLLLLQNCFVKISRAEAVAFRSFGAEEKELKSKSTEIASIQSLLWSQKQTTEWWEKAMHNQWKYDNLSKVVQEKDQRVVGL